MIKNMKTRCSLCKKIKPATLEYFKRDKAKNNGLSSWCRECTRARDRIYSRKYREENPEWKKDNNRKNTGLVKRLVAEYCEKYPERVKALSIFHRALYSGKIKRGECEICGSEKVDGHHQDYSKPLEVVWLCHRHHKQLHAGIVKVGELSAPKAEK